MLGLYPYAPLNLLLLDPYFPEWLPENTLHNLRVGSAVVTICFYRKAGGAAITRFSKNAGRCTSSGSSAPGR